MKIKRLMHWLVLVMLGAMIASCESGSMEAQNDLSSEDVAWKELNESLEHFRDAFVCSFSESNETRSFFSRLWTAVKADFTATPTEPSLFGLTITPSASKKSWEKNRESNNRQTCGNYSRMNSRQRIVFNEFGSDLFDMQQLDRDMPLTGIKHNQILWKMMKDNKAECSNTTELIINVRNIIDILGYEKGVGSDESAVDYLDWFMDNIYSDDTESMFSNIRSNIRDKADLEIYNTMEKYFIGIEKLSNIDDIKEYTKEYIHIIDESKISQRSKTYLRESLSIVPESYQFWSMIYSLEKLQ